MPQRLQAKNWAGVAAIVLASSVCFGEPIEWPVADGGNGHFYEIVLVDGPVSWFQAVALAELTGGHLATITSEAENDFIFHSLANNPAYWRPEGKLFDGPWLGAFQPSGSLEPAGGWQWVTSEPFVFAPWLPGRPDDFGGGENWLHFAAIDALSPTWNDTSSTDDVRSYIVEFITDCNDNNLPDACDLNCGASGGPCSVKGCGMRVDCNLNGVLDDCDIAAGTSLDVNPKDGVPDECSWFDGECAENDDWSCVDNWNIPDDIFPNNIGDVTFSVTLHDNRNVFLDVDATVDTLRIISGATLQVTQTGRGGDLTIAAPGGMLIKGGSLYINNGRVIDVSAGHVTIEAEGLYLLEPAGGTETSRSAASEHEGTKEIGERVRPVAPSANGFWQSAIGNGLMAFLRSGHLTFGLAPGQGSLAASALSVQPGGTMTLSADMNLDVQGNMTLSGAGAGPCDSSGLRGAIIPPPKFQVVGRAQISVAASLDITGTVDLFVSSENNLILNGDLNHAGAAPDCFDWSKGGLTLSGPKAQTIEAAGRDLGPTLDGFHNGSDTNFSLGKLEISDGASVTLQNNMFNTVGAGACREALYVRELLLRGNSTLTLNNCRVYYQTLHSSRDASIVPVGCGEARQVGACIRPADCDDGNPCTTDRCDLAEGRCVYTNNRKPCNDGLYCTKPDVCSDGVCVGQERCPGRQCNEMERRCDPLDP